MTFRVTGLQRSQVNCGSVAEQREGTMKELNLSGHVCMFSYFLD